MRCPRCQKEVNEENQFCPYCGAKLPKKDTVVERAIKEIRYKQISFVMNRILNIATIVAVVFAIIGVFGPVLEAVGAADTIQIGGLAWFAYNGWLYLNEGVITQGPFYLTFALYILMFIGVLTIAPFAIYKAINGIRRREECKTVPYIILLTIVHSVYYALINCFYYEYDSVGSSYFETSSSWGSVVFEFATPLFTIGLIILLIMKAVLTSSTSKKCVQHIFALICSLTIMNSFTSIFTVLGFQDLNLGEATAFGTLHYFDLVSGMPFLVGTLIVVAFILGLMYTGLCIAYGITTLRNLIKYNNINRILVLSLGIAQAVVTFVLLIICIVFGPSVNLIEGWSNNIFYINSDLVLIAMESMLVLGFSIAMFVMGDEKPADPNIIDVKVDAKDA